MHVRFSTNQSTGIAYVTGRTYAFRPIRARCSPILISAAPCGGLHTPLYIPAHPRHPVEACTPLCTSLHTPKNPARSVPILLLTFMVLSYHQTGSPSQTRQAFVERFPNRWPSDKITIVRNFQKYQRHATSHNRNKGNSGRPKLSLQITAECWCSSASNPEASTRRNNLAHLTMSSFNCIVKFDLKFHPFQMTIRHQLFHGDVQRRINDGWLDEPWETWEPEQ